VLRILFFTGFEDLARNATYLSSTKTAGVESKGSRDARMQGFNDSMWHGFHAALAAPNALNHRSCPALSTRSHFSPCSPARSHEL
jgi:hypothetical protein